MGISTSTGTLTAGQSRTFNLSPASAVTLTLSPNVRVTITETPATVAATGLGGNASRVHEPRLPGVVTYGPYPMGGSVLVEVESNSGSSVGWVRSDSIIAENAVGSQSLVDGAGNRLTPDNKAFGGNPYFAQVTGTTANQYVQLCDIGPAGLNLKAGDTLTFSMSVRGNATSGAKSVGLVYGSNGADANVTAYAATTALSGSNRSTTLWNKLIMTSDTTFEALSTLTTPFGAVTNEVLSRTFDPSTTGKIFVRLGLAVDTDTVTLIGGDYQVARS